MKNIIEKSISLIFTAVLCSVFVLPVSASASAKETVKHIDDITETSEFDNCGIISQIGLFDEEEFDDEMESDDLYANEEGIDDPTGMYKLDDITAETFQKISNIERDNA